MSVEVDEGPIEIADDGAGRRLLALSHRPLLATFVVLQLVTGSTLVGLLPRDFSRLALGSMAALIVGAAALSLARGLIWPVLAAIAAGGLVAAQLLVFAGLSHLPINWNMLFSYLPAVALPLFVLARNDVDWLARFTFVASLGYCIVYAVVSLALPGLATVGADVGLHLLAGDGRGTRLAVAPGYVAYCLCYAVAAVRERPAGPALLTGLAGVPALLALALAQSRAFTVTLVAVVLLHLLFNLGRGKRQVLAIGFGLAAAVNLAGVLLPGGSIYDLGDGDASVAARRDAYAVLAPKLASHFELGLGLPSNATDLWLYAARPYVFWQDLGPFGIWCAFGMLGLLAFLALAIFCIVGPRRPDLSPSVYWAITLSGVVCGLSATFTPDLFGGSSAMIAGLVLAMAFSRRLATLAATEGSRVGLSPAPGRRQTWPRKMARHSRRGFRRTSAR